jgi:glycosyltransferase involved in cell wall biosynthesis
LKIAGEIQPCFNSYWESQVKPHVDGKFIEYVGEADMQAKNELLKSSVAMLFPIQWNEPFGLVMIEAMACGAPVLAFSGGAVEEVVSSGVSGFICKDVGEMAARTKDAAALNSASIRAYVQEKFSTQRMAAEYADLFREVIGERELLPSRSAMSDNDAMTDFAGENSIVA